MHIHSCLSPCGDLGMGPKDIVREAVAKGLDIIAVCDHNTAENAGAVMRAGGRAGIYVIAGMEICSREEVHVVALFESLFLARNMQNIVYSHLPGENNPAVWGEQIVADEENTVLGENMRLLIGATTLSLSDIVAAVHRFDGLCIASHVDRAAYGIISNLGFIPPGLAFDALEVSYRIPLKQAHEVIPGITGYPCVTASDAHFPGDIGRAWTPLYLAAPLFPEIRMALAGRDGRYIGV